MSRNVLVIAAHPDDEVLGCGGTIARHVAEGDSVHVLFMANGVGARFGDGEAPLDFEERNLAKTRALELLGVRSDRSFDFPDNRMDRVALLDIVKPLEEFIHSIGPDTIYTHHCGDLNVDHRLTHQAVLTACRPQPGLRIQEILTFEIVSSTEWGDGGQQLFNPNAFIEITAHWEKKVDALKAYALEMREAPHSRSVDHLEVLARHRGACVGVQKAEAFVLVRRIS
jgi:LmbE family N-acetylglucosaminyl deacetylase